MGRRRSQRFDLRSRTGAMSLRSRAQWRWQDHVAPYDHGLEPIAMDGEIRVAGDDVSKGADPQASDSWTRLHPAGAADPTELYVRGNILLAPSRATTVSRMSPNFALTCFPYLKAIPRQAGRSLSGGQQQQLAIAAGTCLRSSHPSARRADRGHPAQYRPRDRPDLGPPQQGIRITLILTEQHIKVARKLRRRLSDDGERPHRRARSNRRDDRRVGHRGT